jgi:predicted ATPase with chaperone activity
LQNVARGVDGAGRTVHELLAGKKYSIDYYQREYKWQQKHVADLAGSETVNVAHLAEAIQYRQRELA